ncbi:MULTISPECIES: helix-turn-helix domain-containing protein [Thermogemmatispora]|jgi:DNA-binding XRE family transcriptional regulator|uniref:helix-turn-helix domain-containing protein n=1 Tax=Thermogemmatispora TaxID=768669 RepID=UPI00069AB5D9|nr:MULTISPECIES: helix-turn-helix transcriptional regulator [Thermogemmatispora]
MIRLKVKEILEAQGKTQSWLARKSQVPDALVRRMIREPTSYHPTLPTLVSIAKALRVRIEDLYEELPDEDEDHRPT